MRTVRPLLAVGLLLALAGFALADAKEDAEKNILGKWQATEEMGDVKAKIVLEFTDKGAVSVKIEAGGTTIGPINGKYKLLDAETIEVTVEGRAEKNKIKVGKDDLSLTDTSGKAMKFGRVK